MLSSITAFSWFIDSNSGTNSVIPISSFLHCSVSVVVTNPRGKSVISNSYRLVPGKRASCKTVPSSGPATLMSPGFPCAMSGVQHR